MCLTKGEGSWNEMRKIRSGEMGERGEMVEFTCKGGIKGVSFDLVVKWDMTPPHGYRSGI